MKSVYLEPPLGRRLHSLYRELVDFPPVGYTFLVPSGTMPSGAQMMHLFEQGLLRKIRHFEALEYLIDYLTSPASIFYSKVSSGARPKKNVLTYSSQHLVFRREPWVVDLEFATALVSYGRFGLTKSLVERMLASDYCKAIMPWSDMSKETLLRCLDCRKFEDKIETVHLVVRPKSFVKKYKSEKVRILFVGTGNPWNVAESFQLKGGREVLMAFKHLNERYKNLELVIRSFVPQEILSSTKNANIKIINKKVTWETLSRMFETSDIFLFPTHCTPGMVILDAMSYELPVVATDVWANRELLDDGRTGFLIKGSSKARYYDENFVPLWSDPKFMRAIRQVDSSMVKDLVEKTSMLVEDEKLRRQMGRAARQEVEVGKFSIGKRNEKLKRIFDEATESIAEK